MPVEATAVARTMLLRAQAMGRFLVAGPVISLALLSTVAGLALGREARDGLTAVAGLALGTSPQSRLPVVRHAAGVVLLKEGGRGVGDLIHQLWYHTLEE